jgi:hypothetical protein
MKLLSEYDRIKAAHERCTEITHELRELPPIEYAPKETRALTREYLWTVDVIIRLCDEILKTEPEDPYGDEVDFRIKLEYFQEHYEEIRSKIK